MGYKDVANGFFISITILSILANILFIIWLQKNRKMSSEIDRTQLLRRTFLALAISDLVQSTCFLLIRFWRIFLDQEVVDVNGYRRVFWILFPGALTFQVSSYLWSFFLSLAIYKCTVVKASAETHFKTQITFHSIAWGLGIIDGLFWLIYRQSTAAWLRDATDTDNQMEMFFQFGHASLYTVFFFMNLGSLSVIWFRIRKLFKAVFRENTSVDHSKSQILLMFTFSLYLIPFLVCGSWQIMVLFSNGTYVASNLDLTEKAQRISVNPVLWVLYSIFFPMQALLRTLVYCIKPKVLGRYLSRILLQCRFIAPEKDELADDDEEEEFNEDKRNDEENELPEKEAQKTNEVENNETVKT